MGFPNIIQQVNSKLPLSGGTMTGNINWNMGVVRQNGHSFEFVGDKDLPNQTSFIACRSATHPNESGWFYFGARNKEGGYMGICKPDGTFTWGGNNVITSAGGTISGKLYFTGSHIINNKTGGEIRIVCDDAGTVTSRPALILFEKGNSSYPGFFYLRSADGTKTSDLIGKPDGTLTWSGKPVVVLTESYNSGATFYRKYSDGWIEQGGIFKGQLPATTNVSVSFYKAFKDTNYKLFVHPISGDVSNNTLSVQYGHAYYGVIMSKATSSFVGRGNVTTHWYACGY